jgi:C4-dicarboxylate-specific signal transduction histidine kinase
MIHRDVAQLKRYCLAVALCLLALPVARAVEAPSSCFILVVMASSLYGGRGPALVAVLLGSLAFDLFFLPPSLHHLPTRASFFRFGVFIGAMLLTMEMIERKKRSERARLQLEESLLRTQSKLAKAAQIAAVSELAASIGHEISQPVSAIVANGQACLRWLDATPPNRSDARTAVERIVRDGKDAAEIVKSLRSLFRRSPPEKTVLDLRTLVIEVASLVRGRMDSDGITLETHFPKDVPPVLADKIQLQQVLMNLLTNGIDSMQNIDDRAKRLIVRARRDGDSVLTQVEDSGTGVADMSAVFDSFVTTKEKGMGMGLSICRSIVEAHSGRLWAEANPTGGAIFLFTVPLAEGGDSAA